MTVTRQQEFRKCWFLRIIQPNLYRYRFRELYKNWLFKRHDLTTYPEAIHRIQGLRRRITCRFTVKGRGFSWPISTNRHRPRTFFSWKDLLPVITCQPVSAGVSKWWWHKFVSLELWRSMPRLRQVRKCQTNSPLFRAKGQKGGKVKGCWDAFFFFYFWMWDIFNTEMRAYIEISRQRVCDYVLWRQHKITFFL